MEKNACKDLALGLSPKDIFWSELANSEEGNLSSGHLLEPDFYI